MFIDIITTSLNKFMGCTSQSVLNDYKKMFDVFLSLLSIGNSLLTFPDTMFSLALLNDGIRYQISSLNTRYK